MDILFVVFFLAVIGILLYVALQVSKKTTPGNSDEVRNLIQQLAQRSDAVVQNEMSRHRMEMAVAEKRLREELSGLFRGFGEPVDKRMAELVATQNKNFEDFSVKLLSLIDRNELKMDRVREVIEKKLEGIQKDNGEKLEAMRQTVDEKLQSTLEKRLGESFKQVSDRLEMVHKGLGEMQTLATGVGDLKKVLTNVKTRGIWGEVQLGNLLEQMLTPDQYEKNISTKHGSKDRVEFAIKLPGREEHKTVYVPIDAKFPQEDYQRLVEAYDLGDIEQIEATGKKLEERIKLEAKSIAEKYLDPPHTTDFGILFLPYESLYAEVLRRKGLGEYVQRVYRVNITGPTTLSALLNSLQMGFRTLAIEKRSSEVWDLLSGVKTEFNRFGGILEKTHKKLQEASNTIEDAAKKSRTIERKLNQVQALPHTSAPELIESALAPETEEF